MVMPRDARSVFLLHSAGKITKHRLTAQEAELATELAIPGAIDMAVHADGETLFVASSSGLLLEWNSTTDTSNEIARIDSKPTAVAVSETGSWLAAGTSVGELHLWNRSVDGTSKHVKVAGDSKLSDVVFSHDEAWVYAGDAARVLRGWRLNHPAEQPEVTIRGHYFDVLDISKDGSQLVSGGGRAELPELWSISPESLLQMARAKAGRDLTEDELARFGLEDQAPDRSRGDGRRRIDSLPNYECHGNNSGLSR